MVARTRPWQRGGGGAGVQSRCSTCTLRYALSRLGEQAAWWQKNEALEKKVWGRGGTARLQHLRGDCPPPGVVLLLDRRRMGEQQFWTVYFSLVRDFLPQPHGNAPAPASASPAVQKLPLGALQGGRDAPAAALSGAAIGTEAAASVVGGAGAAELTAVSGDEASRGSEGAAAGEDDSSGSGDGDEDDGVASLDDDDPELAEYLQVWCGTCEKVWIGLGKEYNGVQCREGPRPCTRRSLLAGQFWF
eukprot:365777-Chlamydomonas_euryale.AAC.6